MDFGVEFFSKLFTSAIHVLLNLPIFDLEQNSFIQMMIRICLLLGWLNVFKELKGTASGFLMESAKMGFFTFVMYANFGVINPRDTLGYKVDPNYDYSLRTESSTLSSALNMGNNNTHRNVITLDRDIFNILASMADSVAMQLKIIPKKTTINAQMSGSEKAVAQTFEQDLQAKTVQKLFTFMKRAGMAKAACSENKSASEEYANCILGYIPALDENECMTVKNGKLESGFACKSLELQKNTGGSIIGWVAGTNELTYIVSSIIVMFSDPLVGIIIPLTFYILTLLKQGVGFLMLVKFAFISSGNIIVIKMLSPLMLVSSAQRTQVWNAYKKLATVALYGLATEFVILISTIFSMALHQAIYEMVLPSLLKGSFATNYSMAMVVVFVGTFLVVMMNIEGYRKVPEIADNIMNLSVSGMTQVTQNLITNGMNSLGTVAGAVTLLAGGAVAAGAKVGAIIGKITGKGAGMALGKVSGSIAAKIPKGTFGPGGSMARVGSAMSKAQSVYNKAGDVKNKVIKFKDDTKDKMNSFAVKNFGSQESKDQLRELEQSNKTAIPSVIKNQKGTGGTDHSVKNGSSNNDLNQKQKKKPEAGSEGISTGDISSSETSKVITPHTDKGAFSSGLQTVGDRPEPYARRKTDEKNPDRIREDAHSSAPRIEDYQSKRSYREAVKEYNTDKKKGAFEKNFGGKMKGKKLTAGLAALAKFAGDSIASGGENIGMSSLSNIKNDMKSKESEFENINQALFVNPAKKIDELIGAEVKEQYANKEENIAINQAFDVMDNESKVMTDINNKEMLAQEVNVTKVSDRQEYSMKENELNNLKDKIDNNIATNDDMKNYRRLSQTMELKQAEYNETVRQNAALKAFEIAESEKFKDSVKKLESGKMTVKEKEEFQKAVQSGYNRDWMRESGTKTKILNAVDKNVEKSLSGLYNEYILAKNAKEKAFIRSKLQSATTYIEDSFSVVSEQFAKKLHDERLVGDNYYNLIKEYHKEQNEGQK